MRTLVGGTILLAVLALAPRPARAVEVEYFGLRLGGGNYGGGATFHICLLRWRWFYLEPFHLGGGGGGPGAASGTDAPNSYYGKGGILAGVPIRLGDQSPHEIRLGLGLSGGFLHNQWYGTMQQFTDTYVFESYGPFLEFEAYYRYQLGAHLGLLVGGAATVVVRWEQKNYYWVNGPASLGFFFVGVSI